MTRPSSHPNFLPSILLVVLACLTSFALAKRPPHSGPVAGFVPKKWPAVVAIVLYSISGLIHWYHWYRWGKRPMLTLTLGMSFIVLGFILRIVYSNDPDSLNIYVFTTLFVLLSPCAFLATDYIILYNMSKALDPKSANDALFIAPRKIVKLFIASDVSTFLLQAAGGGLSVQPSAATIGKDIALIGLVLQLISFALFSCLLLIFGWRVETRYTQEWQNPNGTGKSMRVLFFAVCFTCIGVLIRSTFRIVEYSGGYTGFVAIHEGYFYLLDALPLWVSMTTYCFFWPTWFIYDSNSSSPVDVHQAGEAREPTDDPRGYELKARAES